MVRDKQIRPCSHGIAWTEADYTGCLFEASLHRCKIRPSMELALPALRGREKTCDRSIYNFLSPAALISTSEDISIPSIVNIVPPSVVIPAVSVPTSSWTPDTWGTWPFVTISGVGGNYDSC